MADPKDPVKEAATLAHDGKLDEARAGLEAAAAGASGAAAGRLLLATAELHLKAKDSVAGARCADAARMQFSKAGNDEGEAQAIVVRGLVHLLAGTTHSARQMANAARAKTASRDVQTRAGTLLRETGRHLFALHRYPEAWELLEESVAAFRMAGATAEMGTSIDELGGIRQIQGRTGDAERLHSEALETHRSCSHWAGAARALSNLGNLHYLRGDLAGAEARHREALALEEDLGMRQSQAITRTNLANDIAAQGRLSEAEGMLADAIRLCREEGLTIQLGLALNSRGSCAVQDGRLDEGESCYRESLEVFRAAADNVREAVVLGNLGGISWDRNDLRRADREYADALSLHTSLRDEQSIARVECALGAVRAESGRRADGEKLVRSSIKRAVALGEVRVEAYARGALGEILQDAWSLDEAASETRKAMALFTRASDSMHARRARLRLAAILSDIPDLTAAETELAAARTIAPVEERRTGMPERVDAAMDALAAAHLSLARARAAGPSGDTAGAAAHRGLASAALRDIEKPPDGAPSLLLLHAETRHYATILRRRLGASAV